MGTTSSRTLLETLMGLFVRRTADWLPISCIVALLDTLDVEESSARTEVSRLKKRRWLVAEQREGRHGYRLTDFAKESLDSADTLSSHVTEAANLADGWSIVHVSVPELQRANRQLLRSKLVSLGFGNIGGGVWIAPARMHEHASLMIHELGLAENTNLFVGDYKDGRPLKELVRSSWNIDEIHNRYLGFVKDHTPDLEALRPIHRVSLSEREAFVRLMRTLDDWRTLPVKDPGLPRELLPADWAGDTARLLVKRVVAELDRPALSFVHSMAHSVPGA